MKVAVVMNAGAGSIGRDKCEERRDQILEAFADAGIEAIAYLCEPAHLTATARDAARSGVDAVVAAGGDGTVSAVASALVDGDVPLAVLPLGTLNHFAKDLGIPLALPEAARAVARAQRTQVDVAELNGRTFVNNSSIGLYPEIVIQRDRDRRQTGRGKWRAMAIAAVRVLRRFPLLVVRLFSDKGSSRARTPLVFVGNNAYAFNVLELGRRARLDAGHLSLYMVRSTSRVRLFWLMVRALLSRLDAARDFEAHAVREVTVRTGKRRLVVALDGEVVSMTPPLQYRIRPRALPILVTAAARDANPEPLGATG